MPSQQADIAHHPEVEDPSCLVSSTSCQKVSAMTFKNCFGNGVLVAVQGCETSPISGIPELDLVVFGT